MPPSEVQPQVCDDGLFRLVPSSVQLAGLGSAAPDLGGPIPRPD